MADTFLPLTQQADLPTATPRAVNARRGRGDRWFFRGLSLSGILVLAIMASFGIFLTKEAIEALRVAGPAFLTTPEWEYAQGKFGVASLVPFTIAIALVAVAIALPISIGTALFITDVAPVKLRGTLVALVDLMAAVPSVVYGLWGLYFLQGHVVPIARWLNSWFGWIPFFSVSGADPNNPLANQTVYSASTFIAGLVVALMVTPIQCSVMREVFSQVPIGEREGAYALGGTRWGMIRVVTFPFGRGGMIGGTMLGLGRALGETIAVLLIISPRFDFTIHLIEAGSNSVSALIAARYNETTPLGLSALFAAGLVLFLMTLGVNFVASAIVARSRSGASSEA